MTQVPVTASPSEEPVVSDFPEVFTSCAVTRSMSRAAAVPGQETTHENSHTLKVSLPTELLSVSPSELVKEQRADPSLQELCNGALSAAEMETAAQGYFFLDEVLVRKWLPQGEEFIGDPVVQIVVPKKFREAVLKIAHDNVAGHLGVRKTYDRVLRNFFGLD